MSSRVSLVLLVLRRRIHRLGLACVLIGLAVAIGGGETFALAAERSADTERGRARSYDGETVFRGLIFGLGPVARLVPEIWEPRLLAQVSAPEVRAQWRETADRVIAGIRARDPEFFESFGARIQSGDQVLIEQGFRDAARLIREVAASDFGVPPQAADGAGQGQCLYIILPGGMVLDLAAVAFTYVNSMAFYATIMMVNTFYVVDTIFFIDNQLATASGGSSAGSSEENAIKALRREMWIDLLAKRLGGAPLPSALRSLQ